MDQSKPIDQNQSPNLPVPPGQDQPTSQPSPAGESPAEPPETPAPSTTDQPAVPQPGPSASPGAGGTIKGSVLVADDDITLRDMYQTRLETEGYKVLVAADGEETLKIIKEQKPDLVLLDIMMPKMNGLDVLAQMKKDETMKAIPVIILTALIQDLTKVKSLMSGADDYLMKSEVMPGEVIKKVESVLAKSRGQ
jgi:CheY-like chemotaxis protein